MVEFSISTLIKDADLIETEELSYPRLIKATTSTKVSDLFLAFYKKFRFNLWMMYNYKLKNSGIENEDERNEKNEINKNFKSDKDILAEMKKLLNISKN